MRIVYDNIIFSLQKAGGISVYWSELLQRMGQSPHELSYYEAANQNAFRKNLGELAVHQERIPLPVLRYLPFYHRLPDKTLLHSSYYRVAWQAGVASVVTVYDFTYEYYRKGVARFIHSRQKSSALQRAAGIICISVSTKKDLLSFHPGIDPGRIRIIYPGVGPSFQPLAGISSLLSEKFPAIAAKNYILFVGDRDYYKNFKIVLEALPELGDLILVLVGGGPLKGVEKEAALAGRLFHLQGIDSDLLNVLYNGAFCLVYPSAYEGFGFPVVEAMRAGCPVIAARSSSIPEVAGSAALFLEPLDKVSLVDQVKRLENQDLRAAMIGKGLEQARLFSWEKCFSETLKFYDEIYEREFG